jgi:uncharacterized OsmC-like protein
MLHNAHDRQRVYGKEEQVSDDAIVNAVRSTSSGVHGRSLNSVGHHHFVIDSPSLGEEITSTDAFLAGISSCGVNLVERVAREQGILLQRTEVAIEGRRDRQRSSDFERIHMRFTLTGPTQEQAALLVGRYQDG